MSNSPKIKPDELYLLNREDLLSIEDSSFNSMIQAVADSYSTRNDQSVWGLILRAVSQEMAQLEFAKQYDIASKDPSLLTPPDIKRRWAGPLYLSRNYPTATQYDRDYKLMLVGLIQAYRKGATVQGIADVIKAYTGIRLTVQELYKLIAPGSYYNQSDRNAISVAYQVAGTDAFSKAEGFLKLQQVTSDLYAAIDLAKPAHVGLNLTAVFGSDENIDHYIMGNVGWNLPNAATTPEKVILPNGSSITNSPWVSMFGSYWLTDAAGDVLFDSVMQPDGALALKFLNVSLLNPTISSSDFNGFPTELQTDILTSYAQQQNGSYAPVTVPYPYTTNQNSDGTQTVNITMPGIQEFLRIFVQLDEPQPLNATLIQAPLRDPASKDTRIAGYPPGQRPLPVIITSGVWAAYPTYTKSQYTLTDGFYVLNNGGYLPQKVTAEQWNAYPPSVAAGTNLIQALYSAYTETDNSQWYLLNDAGQGYRLLIDASGNITGDVTTVQGVLSPQENTVWEISDDADSIFELN